MKMKKHYPEKVAVFKAAKDLKLQAVKWYSSSGHTEKYAINKQLFGGATCQKRERVIQNNLKLTLSN